MCSAHSSATRIRAALPTLKQGSLFFYGDVFGGRIDNHHVAVSVRVPADDMVEIEFDGGETLRVWNPDGVVASPTEFTIWRARRVRWEWHHYGRPRTPENRHFIEYVPTDSEVEVRSDWESAWRSPQRRGLARMFAGLLRPEGRPARGGYTGDAEARRVPRDRHRALPGNPAVTILNVGDILGNDASQPSKAA